MERRTLEMIAEGMTLGDSFVVLIDPIKRKVHLGDPFELSVTCVPESGGSLPVNLKKDKGIDVTCTHDPIGGEKLENGSIRFKVPVILTGRKGTSTLKLILKGEEYRATLALAEIDLDVHSTELLVSIDDPPFRWDGGSSTSITVHIINKGGSKIKVIPRSILQDKGGRPLIDVQGKKVTINRETTISLPLERIDDIENGPMDIRAELEVDGEQQVHILEDSVVIGPVLQHRIEISAPISIQDGLIISMSTIENRAGPIKALLDGETDLALLEEKIIDDVHEFSFSLNGVTPGTFDLTVTLDGMKIHEEKIMMIEGTTRFRIRTKCAPHSIMAGEITRLIIDLDQASRLEGSGCILKLDIPSFKDLDLGEVPEDGHIEVELPIQSPSRTGNVSGRLEFIKDQDMVHEEILPRLFSIRSQGDLGLEMILPGDLGKGIEEYLFPGETIISTREHSDVTLSRASTGRILVARDGSILPEGDDGNGTASRAILHDTFLDAILSGRSISKARDIFQRTVSMIDEGNIGIAPNVDSEENGYIGSLASHLIKGEKDPSLIVHSKDGKDPVVNISLLLKELTGHDGIGSMGEPDKALRSLVERTIKTMKGRKKMVDRSLVLYVFREISKRGRGSLGSLGKMASLRSIDSEKVSIELRKVLFYLLAYSLVRVEIVSRWSDPVVSTWDDLKIVRQRSIKGSVQSTFDTVSMITDIYRAAEQRWKAYQHNVGSRKKMRGMYMLEVSRSKEALSGMAGDVWDILLTIKAPLKCPSIEFIPHLSLPRGGWSLESPRSIREGDVLVLGEERMKGGERRDIELKIRSPASPSGGERAYLYLFPHDIEMEEEP